MSWFQKKTPEPAAESPKTVPLARAAKGLKVSSILAEDTILFPAAGQEKSAVLQSLAAAVCGKAGIADWASFLAKVQEREQGISTTLDTGLQLKAENALASIPQQAAIVALQPSTGNVLAVAQNSAADAQGPIALTGLYPPGSTFKTVTTSAALEAGTATPDTVLPCPGTENIEGRQIPNDDNFDLGDVPLHTAFARSCNTTMGRLGVGLPADGLQQTALQYGLGVDYVTPGLTTVTGNVPVADSPAARVESGIGQGQVTATPFGMAMVAASIANGSTPSPMIVQGQPGTADKTAPTVPANVTSDLRTMMRETVTGGTATALQDIPGLLGKTGTAESGNVPAHGWFVGIKDDLAFAVFIATGDSSAPAVQAAGRFLR